MNNRSITDINLEKKIQNFESKLLTYIHIYNLKYTKSNDTHINDTHIKLERIGNIEIIDKNVNNYKKNISNQLRYLIHKKKINAITKLLYIIVIKNGYDFDFINYNYDLYNVFDISNIYIIEQKLKNLIYKFEGHRKIFIFIRGHFFVHYY